MITTNTLHGLGVLTNSQEIEQAVNELKASGFSMDKVSVIAKDLQPQNAQGEPQISDRIDNQDVDTIGIARDTLKTSTWMGLLVGLSSLALPGLGVILAAGSLGVALVSSVGGMAVGVAATQNLVKALTDLGIPEEKARVYSDSLQQGYYLLIIESTKTEIQKAEEILSQQNIHNWGIYDSLQAQNQ